MPSFYTEMAIALIVVATVATAGLLATGVIPMLAGSAVVEKRLPSLDSYTIMVAGAALKITAASGEPNLSVKGLGCTPQVEVKGGVVHVEQPPVKMPWCRVEGVAQLPARLERLEVDAAGAAIDIEDIEAREAIVKCDAAAMHGVLAAGNATFDITASAAKIRVKPLSNNTLIKVHATASSVKIVVEADARVEVVGVSAATVGYRGCSGASGVRVLVEASASAVKIICEKG